MESATLDLLDKFAVVVEALDPEEAELYARGQIESMEKAAADNPNGPLNNSQHRLHEDAIALFRRYSRMVHPSDKERIRRRRRAERLSQFTANMAAA